MKTKKNDPIITMDFYNDLLKNEVIVPEKLVRYRDAKRVRAAMRVIKEFEQTLLDDELLEEL